jgi:hypothetical protein
MGATLNPFASPEARKSYKFGLASKKTFSISCRMQHPSSKSILLWEGVGSLLHLHVPWPPRPGGKWCEEDEDLEAANHEMAAEEMTAAALRTQADWF